MGKKMGKKWKKMARFKGVAGEYPRGGRTGDKEQWRQRVNPYNVILKEEVGS